MIRRASTLGAALIASAITSSIPVRAEAAPDASPPPAPPPPPEEARGWETPPGTTPEDVALFVPRVVLTVPRLALTIVFVPIDASLRFLSRRVGGSASTPDDDVRTVAVLPHLSYLSAFGTTVGASARYENMGGHGEELAVNGAFGGVYAEAMEARFHADRFAGSRLWLESRTRYEIRPQEIWNGIGDDERSGRMRETRFREDRLTVVERAGRTFGEPGRLVKFGGSAIFEHSSFGSKDVNTGEPSIETIYDRRALRGFDRGASTAEAQANLVIDTRDVTAAPSSGILANAFAGFVPPLADFTYGHVGIDATGYIDLYKKTRVLVVRGAVEGVLGSSFDIPFSRLAALGGPDGLRGYRLNRYRDRESVLAAVEYRYPIHRIVSGALFVDAGHVASDPGALFALSRWRASGGIGLHFRSNDATFASLDVAYGDGVQLYFTLFPFDSRAQWNKP